MSSWDLIVSIYEKNGISWRVVSAFMNRFPQLTYPLGEVTYWESVKQYGQETWWAPHNVWRQVCHTFGGLMVSIPFFWAGMWAVLGMLVLISAKEAHEVYTKNNFSFKTFLDIGAWTFGAFLAVQFVSGVLILIETFKGNPPTNPFNGGPI